MRFVCLLVLLVESAAMRLSATLDRRAACVAACRALPVVVAGAARPVFASDKTDAVAVVRIQEQRAALKQLLKDKDRFIKGLEAADADAPQLPAAIPFKTFQQLDKFGPDFIEAAIDYAEAARNARDLVKLAKLSKSTVEVTTKVAGQPRETILQEYGSVEGSGLDAPGVYAERALKEVLGAQLCLEAAAAAAGL